jgi:putative ABC transport system permease protein
LIVKSAVPPATLIPEIRRRFAKFDPDQHLFGVRTEGDIAREENELFRFNSWLFGAFAGIASVLALTGIYGLMAYSVASRTQEFGVRLALGATAPKILRQVLRQAALLAVIGSALGLIIAFPAGRLLTRSLSYMHLLPTGLLLEAGIITAVVFVAVLAALVPARRAAKVDPMVALRYE